MTTENAPTILSQFHSLYGVRPYGHTSLGIVCTEPVESSYGTGFPRYS